MVQKAGFLASAVSAFGGNSTGPLADHMSRAASPLQVTPEHVLNSLAIYRMARHEIHEQEQRQSHENPGQSSYRGLGSKDISNATFLRVQETSDVDITPPPGHQLMQVTPQPIGEHLQEALELPTSFDDLQSYMQSEASTPPTGSGTHWCRRRRGLL